MATFYDVGLRVPRASGLCQSTNYAATLTLERVMYSFPSVCLSLSKIINKLSVVFHEM